jgi:hypothetical protein
MTWKGNQYENTKTDIVLRDSQGGVVGFNNDAVDRKPDGQGGFTPTGFKGLAKGGRVKAGGLKVKNVGTPIQKG